jgi:hypothetical protein
MVYEPTSAAVAFHVDVRPLMLTVRQALTLTGQIAARVVDVRKKRRCCYRRQSFAQTTEANFLALFRVAFFLIFVYSAFDLS